MQTEREDNGQETRRKRTFQLAQIFMKVGSICLWASFRYSEKDMIKVQKYSSILTFRSRSQYILVAVNLRPYKLFF